MNDELDIDVEGTNIAVLVKFVTAVKMLGEVYNTDSPFAQQLVSVHTENFLQDASDTLSAINTKLEELV